MRAIVDINGKQYNVEEGRYVEIDSYVADINQEVVLGNVVMVVAGDKSLVGSPFIQGATVKTTVRRHGRGPKVLVYKMRCKKGYRRKNGHRQGFTQLLVSAIDFNGRDKFPAAPKSEVKPFVPKEPVEKKAKVKTAKTNAPKTKAAVAAPAEKKSAPKEQTAEKKPAKADKPATKASAPAAEKPAAKKPAAKAEGKTDKKPSKKTDKKSKD